MKHLSLIVLLILLLTGAGQEQVMADTPGTSSCMTYIKAYRYNSNNLLDSGYACAIGNCSRSYLLSAYEDDSVTFYFNLVNPGGNFKYHMIYTPPFGIPDTLYPLSPFGPIPNHIPGQDMQVGTFKIVFSEYSSQVGGWYDKVWGIITILPRINKVWIDAPAICDDDFLNAQQDYKFYIRTDPPLATAMFPAPLSQDPSVSPCGSMQSYAYSILPDVRFPQQYSLPVNGMTYVKSSQLPLPANYQEYTVPYADVANHLTSAPGYPLEISLNFSDNVESRTLVAPLIINTTHKATIPPYFTSAYHKDVYTVTGNEVWTPQNNPVANMYGNNQSLFRIEKGLNIAVGASLTINNMTLEFGPQAKVVLEATAGSSNHGSLLTLNNSKLTAYHECGNEDSMWAGVIIEGNASKGQYVIAANGNGVNRYQGTLIMNSSEISYAKDVKFWSGDPADWPMTSAGGVLIADNSRFYNNLRSAEFMKYSYTSPLLPSLIIPNASRFTKCLFEVDGNYPSNDFFCFISGWAVRGVLATGCRFENNGYTGTTKGIYGNDLGISVNTHWSMGVATPSVFKNLTIAVENKYISGPASLIASGANFTGNRSAVVSDGIFVPRIQDNHISNGSFSGLNFSRGITINTGSGYKVTGNTISNGSFGVVVINTGSDPNFIQRNSFSHMGTGTLSNYKNRGAVNAVIRGLQILCNTHSQLSIDMAALGTNNIFDGIQRNQGSMQKPAGNTFYTGSVTNIYNPVTQVGSINYYYRPSPVPTHYGSVNTISTSASPQCQEETFTNPTFPGSPSGVFDKVAKFLGEAGPEGYNKDSLYYWIDRWQSPYGLLLKTDMLTEDGGTTVASNLYNTIDDVYVMDSIEKTEFIQYGRTLLDIRINLKQNNKTIRQINGEQVNMLVNIANNAKLWAKVRAQNWLTLYDGRQFPLSLLYPEEGVNDGMERPGVTIEEPHKNTVYPNPVPDLLQVNYTPEHNVPIRLELFDITGKKVTTISLKAGLNMVNVKALRSGIFYYKILENETVKLQGKLVKQ